MNAPLNRTGPFICPKCGKQFKYSRGRSAACLVFHPPGSCCHHNQYEVTDLVAPDTEPPQSPANPPKEATQSDKGLEELLKDFEQQVIRGHGGATLKQHAQALAKLQHLIAEETNTARIEEASHYCDDGHFHDKERDLAMKPSERLVELSTLKANKGVK